MKLFTASTRETVTNNGTRVLKIKIRIKPTKSLKAMLDEYTMGSELSMTVFWNKPTSDRPIQFPYLATRRYEKDGEERRAVDIEGVGWKYVPTEMKWLQYAAIAYAEMVKSCWQQEGGLDLIN